MKENNHTNKNDELPTLKISNPELPQEDRAIISQIYEEIALLLLEKKFAVKSELAKQLINLYITFFDTASSNIDMVIATYMKTIIDTEYWCLNKSLDEIRKQYGNDKYMREATKEITE